MTDLSPQAQAVMIAATNGNTNVVNDPVYKQCIAAALRVAADQVVPDDYDPPRGMSYPEKEAFIDGKCVRNEDVRQEILAIAAELEGANG